MAQVGIFDLWHSADISRFNFQSSASMHRSEDLRRFEGFSGGCILAHIIHVHMVSSFTFLCPVNVCGPHLDSYMDWWMAATTY